MMMVKSDAKPSPRSRTVPLTKVPRPRSPSTRPLPALPNIKSPSGLIIVVGELREFTCTV